MRPSIQNQKLYTFYCLWAYFMIDHWIFQELFYMNKIFKIYITVKFSDFVIRSLFQPGAQLYNFETDFCDVAIQLGQDLIKGP